MHELFYRYKICRLQPSHTVSSAAENSLSAATLPVVASYHSTDSAEQMIKKLVSYPQVRFVLSRIGIVMTDLEKSTMSREELLSAAHKVSSKCGGKYITTIDIVAAYLLTTEDESRLLFTQKFKSEDMLPVISWAKLQYPQEENPPVFRMHVSGGGLGESLVSGWTLETQKYTKDFTYVSLTKNPHILGREKEFEVMQSALLKRENNNILLIGEMGGGKEALVEKLAIASYAGQTEHGLTHKKILELMVGPLIAGATDRGQLEVRLQALIEEISHAGNIILYIPEFQDLLGSSSFAMNLSGALYPYLQGGNLPVVATITSGHYKQYLEGNPLTQVFSLIHVDSPKENVVELMLMEKAVQLEEKNDVIIPYQAIKTAILHANRYNPESILPGSAVSLLDDVISTILSHGTVVYGKTKKHLMTEDDVVKQVEGKTSAVLSAPNDEEKELLLHLEDRLHERVIGQNRAVSVVAEAMRRLRSGMVTAQRPTSFLFLGPTGVGKTETARALATLYYGGESSMIRLDMSEYSDELGERRLLGSPPGQGDERGELSEKVKDHPNALILLDEFEKAHPRILDLFLQVFEDGRLTDNKGHTVSFVNSLIIATSNAGSEFIRQEVANGTAIDSTFEKKVLDYLQTQHLFKPELLNRFDNVVTFQPLLQEDITRIAQLLLEDVKKRLVAQDIFVELDEAVLTYIAKGGYDPQFGARPLRRFIQSSVEDLLATKMLAGEIKRGDKVQITLNEQGILQLVVTSTS